MPARKGLLAPQNTFLDTIATRFDGTHSNFVLGNAKIASASQTPKNVYPIVYCSDGFCELTGYSRAQIMQKSCACNFLYGQKTDVQNRESISRALEQKQELKLEVILYKSSGTPFWCLLDIVPIQNEKHEVVLFLCSHKDITKQKLHEQQQQQLAQLHLQKQQQIADHQQQQLQQQQANLHQPPAAASGELSPGSKSRPDALGNSASFHQQQQQQDSAQTELREKANQNSQQENRQPNELQPTGHIQPQQKLEEADEAELAAIANQNALLSMDEFGLEDSAGENEFDDGDDSEDHDKHTASQYSRRRSRAVLYQLSGHYGYRRSVNMKTKLKLNNRMNIPEYKTTTIEKQRFILSHYGVGKSCWDWLILIVSFYVAIVVPYNATFKDKKPELKSDCKIDLIDIFVEVVFVIDVILNFRTTFVNRKGEVVTRPKIICKHYVRGWFLVDACAALPFDLLCSMNIYNRFISKLDLNLLKLIRLLRLARLLQKMDRYSQYSYIILTLLMLIFSLLAHWCACIWYVIAMEEIDRNPSGWKLGWIHQLSDKLGYSVVGNTTDMASSYVTALYFTTSSLTSVGFGNVSANTNAEKIFSIVIMLIGALMHAVVFGNVTALIRVMYARRSNYQTRLRDLKDFFRLHQLPKELQQRMSDYFQTTWSLNHGIETYEILKDFPEELRGDVSLHLHREVLSLPIFETAPQGFLKSLARHIESKFCCPTEYLIHRGDALSYLYLVCNGSMEVLQDNMVVAILGKGDLVGYDVNAIITPEHTQFGLSKLTSSTVGFVKSSSDLKALTYCDLKCVHISGLLDVLKLYPEFSDTFHREIVHDLSFNLRETHDEPSDGETDDEGGADQMGPPPTNGNGAKNGSSHNNGGGGNNGGRNRSPPPNIGHLYRSITAAGGNNASGAGGDNRIGRYDHDDDEANDADHEEADEDLVEVDEEDEEEEEEEDDDEEDAELDEENVDDDDDDDQNHNNDDPGGGKGGGGDDDQPDAGSSKGAGVNQNGSTSNENGSGGAGGRDQGGRRMSDASTVSAALQTGQESVSAVRGFSMSDDDEAIDGQPNVVAGNHRRGRQQVVGASSSRAAEARQPDPMQGDLRRRMRQSQEDWQSAHSYDGLMSSKRKSGLASELQHKRITKNNSDDMALDSRRGANRNAAASNNRLQEEDEELEQPRPTGLLRSATGKRSAGNKLQQQSSSSLARRPLLSFDLSRNTTAIVDRRRRSAGCIARPILTGALANAAASKENQQQQVVSVLSTGSGGQASRRFVGHSSLLHINEHEVHDGNSAASASLSQQQLRAKGKFTVRSGSQRLASSSVAKKQNQTSKQARASQQQQYSTSDGFKNIDDRITTISTSVKEMKQELRQELEQFRSAMQVLMQFVSDKQQPQQHCLPARSRLSSRRKTAANNNNSFVANSQSASSLPVFEPMNQDTPTRHQQVFVSSGKLRFASLDLVPSGSTTTTTTVKQSRTTGATTFDMSDRRAAQVGALQLKTRMPLEICSNSVAGSADVLNSGSNSSVATLTQAQQHILLRSKSANSLSQQQLVNRGQFKEASISLGAKLARLHCQQPGELQRGEILVDRERQALQSFVNSSQATQTNRAATQQPAMLATNLGLQIRPASVQCCSPLVPSGLLEAPAFSGSICQSSSANLNLAAAAAAASSDTASDSGRSSSSVSLMTVATNNGNCLPRNETVFVANNNCSKGAGGPDLTPIGLQRRQHQAKQMMIVQAAELPNKTFHQLQSAPVELPLTAQQQVGQNQTSNIVANNTAAATSTRSGRAAKVILSTSASSGQDTNGNDGHTEKRYTIDIQGAHA